MELALRIVLALVLGAAGLAKLGRGRRFDDVLAEHGIAPRLRTPLRVSLTVVELGLAGLIATGAAGAAAGIAVAGLGGVFALFLLRARLRGRRRTTCGCFGGRRTANTLALTARALMLAGAGAVLAIGVPDLSAPSDGSWQPVAIAVLAGSVLMLTVALLALYRQVGVLSLRLGPRSALELEDEGPPIGQAAPMLPGLSRKGAELVAFVSLDCRMCLEILPGLRALERDGVPVRWLREDKDEQAFELWAVPGTPYVVHVIDGVVRAKGLVNSLEQIDWVVDIGTERERLAA
jgi:hypothetical protein